MSSALPHQPRPREHSDPKGIVDHIRTVHFALLLTSTSLAIAALHNRLSIVDRAIEQLDQIEPLREDMTLTRLRQYADDRAFGQGFHPDAENFAIGKITVRGFLRPGRQFLDVKCESKAYSPNLVAEGAELNRGIITLADFETRWNRLTEKTYVLTPSKKISLTGHAFIANQSDPLPLTWSDADFSKVADSLTIFQNDGDFRPIEINRELIDPRDGYDSLTGKTRMFKLPDQLSPVATSPNHRYLLLGTFFFPQAPVMRWRSGDAAPREMAIPIKERSGLSAAMSSSGEWIAINDYSSSLISLFKVAESDQKLEALEEKPSIQGLAPMAFGNKSDCLFYLMARGGIARAKPSGGKFTITNYLPGIRVMNFAVSPDDRWIIAVTGTTQHATISAVKVDAPQSTIPIAELNSFSEVKIEFAPEARALTAVVLVSYQEATEFRRLTVAGETWDASEAKKFSKPPVDFVTLRDELAVFESSGSFSFWGLHDFQLRTSAQHPEFGWGTAVSLNSPSKLIYFPAWNRFHTDQEPARLVCLSKNPESDTTMLVQPVPEFPSGRKLWMAIPLEDPSTFHPVNLQTVLRAKADRKWVRNGEFARSFPDLAEISRHYRMLPMDTIREILKEEAARSGDAVEAFGLKVPADALRQWGVVLIIGIQFYLSRHLRHMRTYVRDAAFVARDGWIGFYRDKLSRGATFITAGIVPVLAAVLLLGRQIWGWTAINGTLTERLFCAGELAACGIFAWLVLRDLTGIWRASRSD